MKLKEFFKEKNIFILLIILFLIIKLYLLFILPEMSDESMYIYKTYLMTEGWNIYKDFGDNRMPGFFLMLYPFIYLYKIVASPPYVNIIYFGRMFALISSLVSIIFIFKIGKYLRNERTGLIAVILFMVSPYALRNYTFVYLENFLTAFSIIGLYFFIRRIEENSNLDSKKNLDKYLLVAGIFFGLAVSIKQMGILIFPVVILILVLKYRTFFLRKGLIISAGGLLVGLVILLYFLVHGTLADFLYSLKISVYQSDVWGNPSREKIISNIIIPTLKSNELLTLIFGFSGIIFSSILFFTDARFGIKTLALWLICYIMVIYTFSNNYPAYYIPIIPSLVIISAYYMDNIIGFLGDYRKDYRKIFVILVFIIFSIYDSYHLMVQYQNFTDKDTILISPLERQISISKYLYNHTSDKDKIFSIDPIYGLIAGREVVNHFTIKNTELPTADELINLGLSRVKYVVIDNRTMLHLKTKWSREIGNLYLFLEIKVENKENIADGIVIELRDKNNVSVWWIHTKNWKIPLNSKTIVNYDIPIEVDKWKKIDIDLSSGFNSYFGYDPKGYKFTIWANANNGSDVKFQIDKIKIWGAKGVYVNESFDEDVSIKNFSIEIKKGTGMGWNKIDVKGGKLDIESFNENYGLSTNISAGALEYILQNFEKEKDFIITIKKKKYEKVSLYRKIR